LAIADLSESGAEHHSSHVVVAVFSATDDTVAEDAVTGTAGGKDDELGKYRTVGICAI
jgi:hypothetical protein